MVATGGGGETAKDVSGWTIDTLRVHHSVLRDADERFDAERDRRYTEVNIEKEKALKIKETADLAALGLAREIQTYKDEKANELRSQIERERGSYALKTDVVAAVEKLEETIKPLASYVAGQQGQVRGSDKTLAYIVTAVSLFFGLAAIIVTIILSGQ